VIEFDAWQFSWIRPIVHKIPPGRLYFGRQLPPQF